MTASLLHCTETEYHADPVDPSMPSLSASTAHTLLSRSPYHAWLEHPRLGGQRRDATRAMGAGTLIHSLVLGQANGAIEIIDAADFKTKASRELRDAALAEGHTPILLHEHQEAELAALRISERAAAKGITFLGESEVKIKWAEGSVLCRGMIDHTRGPVLYDLKTIKSADLRTITRHMTEYGYDVQRAAYVSAWSKMHPELEGVIDFVFVFVETSPPYCVTPCRVDGMRRELGDLRWKRAVRAWERCLRTNTWPDYSEGIATIECRPWELDEEIAKEHAA